MILSVKKSILILLVLPLITSRGFADEGIDNSKPSLGKIPSMAPPVNFTSRVNEAGKGLFAAKSGSVNSVKVFRDLKIGTGYSQFAVNSKKDLIKWTRRGERFAKLASILMRSSGFDRTGDEISREFVKSLQELGFALFNGRQIAVPRYAIVTVKLFREIARNAVNRAEFENSQVAQVLGAELLDLYLNNIRAFDIEADQTLMTELKKDEKAREAAMSSYNRQDDAIFAFTGAAGTVQ